MTIQSLSISGRPQDIVQRDLNKGEELKSKVKLKSGESSDKKELSIEDKFERSSGNLEQAVTYKKPGFVKPNQSELERIKAEADEVHRNLKNLVEKLLERQGLTFRDLEIASENGEELTIEIDDEARAEAQAMIAEDGPLGVEAVSDRLVDFAKAISGGDTSKYEMIKDAIVEGYNQAEKAFGGELPDISKKTLEKTLEKLEEWANPSKEADSL